MLPALLAERGITGRDAAFATELAYGACAPAACWTPSSSAAAGRPVDGQIDPVLLDLLRLAPHQLLRTRVEQHAAVATTVDQAGIEFDTARAGFVNGVLRSIARRDEQSWLAELAPPAGSDPVGHTAFVHAHPRWIAQAFADALGADAGELDAALAADDARPAVHLAARPGVLTAEALAEQVDGTVGRYSPYAVYLTAGDPRPAGGDPRRSGAGAGRGQPAGGPPRPGPAGRCRRRALAGSVRRPGGKTAMLAGIAAEHGFAVTAVEPAERRADYGSTTPAGCRSRCCASTAANPGCRPATSTGSWSTRPAPGWGVCAGGRRRGGGAPRRRAPGWPNQRELLAAAIALTARRGRALCHLLAAPGRDRRRGDGCAAPPAGDRAGHPAAVQPGGGTGPGPYVQLWPHRHGTDAMFAAALQKHD